MICLNDFKRQWEDCRHAVLSAVDRVGRSGWYILGHEVEEFEGALAHFWDLPYAVGVGNGLDAIEIGLRAMGCKPGDQVLTTPLSAFATTLAILRVGAQPVFVDTDKQGLIDLTLCEQAFKTHKSLRYFVPVHLYGFSLDLVELDRIKKLYDLKIVEDCAQSIGAKWRNIPAGTIGQVAATSFYPTKNLGAMGDAGAILTSDMLIVERARSFRHYGQRETYHHVEVGMNSRLDEVQASILKTVFLPRLASWNVRRLEVAMAYLSGIHNSKVTLPQVSRYCSPVWHLFPVQISPNNRDSFINHLKLNGVMSGVHYPGIIPLQPVMKTPSIRYEVIGSLENAMFISHSEVSLPIHPYLTDNEVDQVIDRVNSWS